MSDSLNLIIEQLQSLRAELSSLKKTLQNDLGEISRRQDLIQQQLQEITQFDSVQQASQLDNLDFRIRQIQRRLERDDS